MKRIRLLYFGMMLTFLISLPILAEASEIYQPNVDYGVGDAPAVDLSEDNTMYEATNEEIESKAVEIKPAYGPIHFTYKITNKEIWGVGYSYPERSGPSGRGPGTLSINESTTLNREFTNTISGEYPIGQGNIAASLGITIGVAQTHGTSYTITLAANERKKIIFKAKYYTYRVTQRVYANGLPTNNYVYAYVDVFDSWDYDWIKL